MTRLFLAIVICMLGSSLFNEDPLKNVEIERNQVTRNVVNRI